MKPPYRNVLAIINPVSGQHKPEKTRDMIETHLTELGIDCEVRFTKGEQDPLRWAQAAADEGFDLVVASGGDGTVVGALSGLIKGGGKVPLAIIPAGTASLIARALEIPVKPEKALDVAVCGHAVELDVGYLPHHDRYFALIAGAGWDAQLIEDAPRGLKRRIGFAAYLLSGIKNLFQLRRTTIEIEVDGEVRTQRAHTVMIANIGQIDSAGLALGPDIVPHDGKLDLVIVASSTLTGILRLVYRIATRQFRNYRDLSYVKASRISIRSSVPLPVQIDGEPMGVTPLVAEVVPDAASIIVPEAYYERLMESRRQVATEIA